MITDVPGVRVGHWTDRAGATGCTAVLLPSGAVGSAEVRGGAPATRELALLDPVRRVERVDAVMLCGGSAFGLAAADGAMRWCEERGVGHPTRAGVVPIVPALAIFDLAVGDAAARPDAAAGHAACVAATDGPFETGAVGAGTGARFGFLRQRPGGTCTASERLGDVVVSALVVVNAVGEPAGDVPSDLALLDGLARQLGPVLSEATVIGVIATNARLTKLQCHLVAAGGHDGLARAVDPPHTTFDGDAFVAVSAGRVEAAVDVVRAMASRAVSAAIGSLGA